MVVLYNIDVVSHGGTKEHGGIKSWWYSVTWR